MPAAAVQIIESSDRAIVAEMLAMKEYIDLVVPRGGEELIRFVEKNAPMPVLIGGIGVCHTYVDRARRPGEGARHRRQRQDPPLQHLQRARYARRPRGRRRSVPAATRRRLRREERRTALRRPLLRRARRANPASPAPTDDDYGKEWLSLVASVKVVDSYDDAVDFIYRYSSGHSDAIVTENYTTAMRFLREVDTAVCYVNASTQFTDGAQFGLGAEIIDATQKFHARGPVGLREICTYKWIVFGTGQTRPA